MGFLVVVLGGIYRLLKPIAVQCVESAVVVRKVTDTFTNKLNII